MNVFTLTGEVLLKGTNEAIEELRRLEEQAESTANKLGKLITNMDANFKASSNITINSLSKINKSAKTFESDFSKTMNKIGKTLLTVFSAREIIGFAKDVTEASAEVTAEIVAFEQILGGYADTARIKMEEMAKTAGIVSTRLTPHMTNLTAKFKGLGFKMNDATDLAVRGLEMATDAAAFWDFSLEQSMEHLKSFINGNYEGGEAIGLFANETQMAYYGIEKGLIASRKAWIHLDEATKQATRLEFAERMFEQAQITGHAARESQHFANVLANLKESFRQLKASIGDSYLEDALIPAMNSLRNILDDINENVDKFNAWLEDNEVIKHFSELWTNLSIEVAYSIGRIKAQFEQLAHWLVNDSFLSPTIKPILEWASGFTDNFVKACKGEIGWDEVLPVETPPIIKAGLQWLGETVTALEDGDWNTLAGKVLQIASIKVGLSLLGTAASSLITSINSNLGLFGGGALALGALSIGVQLTEALGEGGSFEEFGANLVAALGAGIGVTLLTHNAALGQLAFTLVMNLELGSKAWDKVTHYLDELKKTWGEINGVSFTEPDVPSDTGRTPIGSEYVREKAKNIVFNPFVQWRGDQKEVEIIFEKLEEELGEEGVKFGEAILEGLELGLEDIPNLSKSQATEVVNAFREELMINSPSKVFQEIGNFLVQGLEIGLEGTGSLGEKVGNDLLTGMRDSLDINSPSEEAVKIAEFFNAGLEEGFNAGELGENYGEEFLNGVYKFLEEYNPTQLSDLVGQLVGWDLMSEGIGDLSIEAIKYASNNPPVTPTPSSYSFTGTKYGVDLGEFNRYDWSVARLGQKEEYLEDYENAVYSARAKYGMDSPEAKEAEEALEALKTQIADLKSYIDSIENPSSETGFFGGLKNLIDDVNEKTNEWKENVGQYIDDFENMFSNASEFVMDFANSFDEIEFTKLEVAISKLENELKTLEENNEETLEKAKEKRDEELDNLEDQLRNKEICHAEYYEKKKQIEDDYEALEEKAEADKEAKEKELLAEKNKLAEKQFNAEKRNQYSNILINTASGIMRAFAENHWIAALGVSAMITAQAVAQKKAVDAQEFVPMLAEGGIVNSATHAIIGEDGREAVVPLERNLEWVDGLARAMSPAIASSGIYSYTPELSSIRSEIVEFRKMVAEFFPQVIEKDTNLSIDGRVLSNAIAPMIDRNLGSISRLKARGV